MITTRITPRDTVKARVLPGNTHRGPEGCIDLGGAFVIVTGDAAKLLEIADVAVSLSHSLLASQRQHAEALESITPKEIT